MGSWEARDYRTVHCGRHGDNREAFMCKHLLEGSDLGFFCDTDDASNPYPDAWCSECERVRGESKEFKDDYARAVIKLVCGECYMEIKARHVGGTEGTARIQ
jgi:hypothetical protein